VYLILGILLKRKDNPQGKILPEMPAITWLIKKFPTFYDANRMFITGFFPEPHQPFKEGHLNARFLLQLENDSI
jgi:hypothetical protein